MILEEKLITLRKSLGLSQEDLANKLDVSRQAVYKWEAGQAIPDISKLKILSTLYNVSIDNLLDNKQDIVYMNAQKARYGKVLVKKALSSDAAEKDNTKLLADEEKKLKTRKLVLGIAKGVMLGFFGLALLFFILSCIAIDDEAVMQQHSSTCSTFIIIGIIVVIAKSILKRVIYPNIEFTRTCFKQEYEKATKELNEKYDTVMQLQPDILAWFVYDTKTNSFGFYFDGEMQFYCPIRNFAKLNVIEGYESLIPFDVNYFDENGKILKYEFSLSTFRDFWKFDKKIKSKEDLEFKIMELDGKTKSVVSEIEQRLDIEKSRI